MNPNAPSPSFELPTPQPGTAGEGMHVPSEQLPPQIEKAAQPAPQSVSAPSGIPAPHPTGLQPHAQAAPTAPVHAPSSTPATADDNDLIEKEWVEKAKQIVAATREDPHAQNKQMSRFKADYLKKRYNKDIKVEES